MQALAQRTGRAARAAAACLVLGLLALGLAACAGTGQQAAVADATRDPHALDLRLVDATLSAGAPDTALHVLDQMLRRNPHDAAALRRRGDALAAMGRPAEAAQSFAGAVAQQPGSLDALTGLARARAAEGNAVDAETAWRSALAVAPDDARVQTGLAISLDLQERHADAQALYRAVLARRPDNAVARSDLGLSLALSGHAAESLPLLQQAALGGFGPDHPRAVARARHNLAVGLVIAGDEPAARRVLSEDMSPSDTDAALAGLRQFAAQ